MYHLANRVFPERFWMSRKRIIVKWSPQRLTAQRRAQEDREGKKKHTTASPAMAETRVLDLKGVIKGQPDVFESEDPAPAAATAASDAKEPGEEFDTSPLDATRAHAVFKGKALHARDVDFTDSIARTHRTGYLSRTEFDSENPVQRFHRLQAETRELMEDLDAIHAEKQADGTETVGLTKDVKFLQETLTQIKLDKALGEASPLSDLRGPQNQLTTKLLGDIMKFKAQGVKSVTPQTEGSTSSVAPGTGSVVYELHYRPEHANFNQAAKYAELERRVTQLEQLVGASDVDKLAASLGAPANLASVVLALTTRANSLSEENLTDVDRRLQTVLSQLEAVKKKQTSPEQQTEYAAKVNELYELGKRWDTVAGALPDLVQRLRSLRTLHEQGAEFSKTLLHLETVQGMLTDSLSANTSTLAAVETSLKENASMIEANIKALEKRLGSA
eukprot:m.320445 g.320445  ORF g.320445 m.320445 type:complete len:446 (-) comp24095_c0_seq1:61-1398(-)